MTDEPSAQHEMNCPRRSRQEAELCQMAKRDSSDRTPQFQPICAILSVETGGTATLSCQVSVASSRRYSLEKRRLEATDTNPSVQDRWTFSVDYSLQGGPDSRTLLVDQRNPIQFPVTVRCETENRTAIAGPPNTTDCRARHTYLLRVRRDAAK